MKEYITPDFNVTIYEIDDIITASSDGSEDITIGTTDPDGEEGWLG